MRPLSHLKYSGAGSGITRISSSEFQHGLFAEVSESPAKTDPGRVTTGRVQIGANRGRNTAGTLAFGYHVLLEMQIFVGIKHEGNFKGQRSHTAIPDSVAIVHFKRQPVPRVKNGISANGSDHTLVTDKSASDNSCELVFLSNGTRCQDRHGHQDRDPERFRRHFSPLRSGLLWATIRVARPPQHSVWIMSPSGAAKP